MKKFCTMMLALTLFCLTAFCSFCHAVEFRCEGEYPHHLQGFASDGESIYWSFTSVLMKSDMNGKKIKEIPVPTHHGDCCVHEGKLYVATHLAWPAKVRTSWIYIYDCEDLTLLDRVRIEEVDYDGVDGITYCDGHFYVCIGKDPDNPREFNLIFKMTEDFKLVEKLQVPGKTTYGVQACGWSNGFFWLGTYSNLGTIQCDKNMKWVANHSINGNVGIFEIPPTESGEPRLMVAYHRREANDPKRNWALVRSAVLKDGKLVWED